MVCVHDPDADLVSTSKSRNLHSSKFTMTSDQNIDVEMTDEPKQQQDLDDAMDIDTPPPDSQQTEHPEDKQTSDQTNRTLETSDNKMDLDNDDSRRGRTMEPAAHTKDSKKKHKKRSDHDDKMKED